MAEEIEVVRGELRKAMEQVQVMTKEIVRLRSVLDRIADGPWEGGLRAAIDLARLAIGWGGNGPTTDEICSAQTRE